MIKLDLDNKQPASPLSMCVNIFSIGQEHKAILRQWLTQIVKWVGIL